MTQRKKERNLLQFNIDDLAQLALTLSTPPKSLTFGRALYRFQYQQQLNEEKRRLMQEETMHQNEVKPVPVRRTRQIDDFLRFSERNFKIN